MKKNILIFAMLVITALALSTKKAAPPCDCGEYQITLEMDEAMIYDGERLVGVLQADSSQAFDKLMIEDNK